MANKKKKSTTTKKKTTKKKTSTNAAKKKNSSSVKSSVKKTTPKKSNVTKKVEDTKIVKNKELETKLPKIKENINLNTKLLDAEKIEVPKKKQVPKTKEVSKNKNVAKKVVKTEKYGRKQEKVEQPTRVEKVESAIKKEIELSSQVLKNKKKKDISKTIARNKKNVFKKKYDKIRRKIKMYGFNSVFPIKKIIPIFLIIAFLIALPIIVVNVLFNKTPKMDLTLIPEKIDQVKTIAFNIDESNEIISSSDAYAGLKDYYEYDFKEVFNLDSKHVSDYVIKYNKSKGYVFIVIKPTEGNEESVKSSIDSFLKSNKIDDYEYLNYGEYLLYVKSKDKDSDKIVLSKIRQSQIRAFNILQELKKDDIEKNIGISSTYYSESLVKTAMLRSDTCQYLIFKPANAMSKTKIMNTMNDYYAGLEAKWQNSNKENYELVKNRHFEEYNGYLIYVVSHDNDLVMNLIKN